LKQVDKKILSYFGEPSIGVWESPDYLVAAFRDGDSIRLDIHRHDLKDGITWDQLREIKNSCGFSDMDAIEFFPREKDVINTGPARHLYVFSQPLPLIRRNGHS
jgi:hypothetical protein